MPAPRDVAPPAQAETRPVARREGGAIVEGALGFGGPHRTTALCGATAAESIAVPVSGSIQRIRFGSSRSQTELPGSGKGCGDVETLGVSAPLWTVSRLCEPSGSTTITLASISPSPDCCSTTIDSALMPSTSLRPVGGAGAPSAGE